MIEEIRDEVSSAIIQGFNSARENYYTSFILLISRADWIEEFSGFQGTGCVIDYQLDRYYDETREAFYLHYLNRNDKKEGFHYDGESGIDDLSIEMMIYCHLWDSHYFLKSLYRLSTILDGKGYKWKVIIPDRGKWTFINVNIVDPLVNKSFELGTIVKKAYSSDIRNAFAHSLYYIDVSTRKICLRTERGTQWLTFDEFQKRFLYSAILMNLMQNNLETYHDTLGSTNSILTDTFSTPEGIKVYIISELVERCGEIIPEFRLVKV